AALLVAWFTVINLLYLLVQIAMAIEGVGVVDGMRAAARFIRAEFRELTGRIVQAKFCPADAKPRAVSLSRTWA
ncbi:MAG: hypothetical protein ACXVAT_20410, partial [Isosphaeraceae bacterium]